jgi:hypothetical protein
MLRERVSSSSVAAIGYDERSETLEVEFLRGTVYRYHGVSVDAYESLRHAPSIGAYFNQHIKDAYAWEQVK